MELISELNHSYFLKLDKNNMLMVHSMFVQNLYMESSVSEP